jgi:hypothetical protein
MEGGYFIQRTSDNGYITAGLIHSSRSKGDMWITKLNSNGTIAWQKAYGRSKYDCAKSIQQTSDGGYIVGGNSYSGAGRVEIWVLKLNNDGTIEWQKTYGGEKQDEFESIQQTSDGGYIIAGTTNSFGHGNDDILVLKLSNDGTVIWQITYGGKMYDSASSIRQTSDGGYILNGFTNLGGRGGDIWVLKLNNYGQVIWQKSYGGMESELPASIQQTTDGGYIVAGVQRQRIWY